MEAETICVALGILKYLYDIIFVIVQCRTKILADETEMPWNALLHC